MTSPKFKFTTPYINSGGDTLPLHISERFEQMAHDIAILRDVADKARDFIDHHAIARPRYDKLRRAVRRAEKDGVI